MTGNDDPVCIGVDYLAQPRYFDGQIDEVRIWSTVRTESQILAAMNRELILVGTETGLVAYYNFDHTSGTVLSDRAANGLDGTLTNMTGNEWLPSTLPWRENNDDYQVGDMNDDGQVGLEEAIIALRVAAGLTPGVALGSYGQLIDADGDGVPDGCDICPGGDDAIDSDFDGMPDACDECPGGDDTIDTDGDGMPDACDDCPYGDLSIDTNGDGIADSCNNRYIFVTSTSFSGNLGGLSGADSQCNTLAEAAGLQGAGEINFKAWLSTATTDAKDRFTHTVDRKYLNTMHDVVSTSFSGMLDGSLEAPIGFNELGHEPPTTYVWTGTNEDGTAREYNCNNWTVAISGSFGAGGFDQYTDYRWTQSNLSNGCANQGGYGTYCIEDR